jgi:hypothetical protein
MPDYQPWIIKAANKMRVNLDNLQGTGPNGRVTITDVRAAAQRPGTGGAQFAAAAVTGRRPAPSLRPLGDPFGDGRQAPFAQVDIYSANPYVDWVLQVGPPTDGTFAQPTFFNSGALPPLTGSGADPSLLVQVPWPFRHTAALTQDASQFLALIEIGENWTEDDFLAFVSDQGRFALEDYKLRVKAWAAARPIAEDALFGALFPPKPEGAASGFNRRPTGEITDEVVQTATEQVRKAHNGGR